MESGTAFDTLMFGDLLEHLHRQGFHVGVDTHLRLQRLLGRVGGNCSPEDLKTLLCPLFAADKGQQDFFYRAFDTYLLVARAGTAAHGRGESAVPARPEREPLLARRWPYVVVGLLLLVVTAGVAYYRERQSQSIGIDGPDPSPTATPTPIPPTAKSQIIDTPSPELVEAVRWLALSGPPILILLYEWYLYNRRRLLLSKLRSSQQPLILPVRPDPTQPNLFDSAQFYNAARLLRLRQETELYRLDILATVKATVASLGYPTFRYKRNSKIPEYLVLIERASHRDHLGRLFEELIEALGQEGVHITSYYFEKDPRVCFMLADGPATLSSGEAGRSKRERGVALRELFAEHENHRLLMFSSGEALLNPITGEMEGWASGLTKWEERAILTPTSPGEWGEREFTLSDQFIIVPATLDGLQSLVDYFELGEVDSLRKWVCKDPVMPPEDFESLGLTESLRAYLGEDIFQWLCACAIYPRLQWDLTLYVGSLPCMPPDLINEHSLLRLIRLPWFQSSSIPDDARQLLLREIAPEIGHEVRAAIVELMKKSGGLAGLEGGRDTLNIAVPQAFFDRHQESFRKLLRALPASQISRDYTLARFLESRPNGFLDFVLPRALLKLFFPNGNTALRMRVGARVALVALVALGLWLAAPQIVSAIKTTPILIVEVFPVPTPTPSASPGGLPTPSPGLTTTPTAQPSASPIVVLPTPTSRPCPTPTPVVTPVATPSATPSPEVPSDVIVTDIEVIFYTQRAPKPLGDSVRVEILNDRGRFQIGGAYGADQTWERGSRSSRRFKLDGPGNLFSLSRMCQADIRLILGGLTQKPWEVQVEVVGTLSDGSSVTLLSRSRTYTLVSPGGSDGFSSINIPFPCQF